MEVEAIAPVGRTKTTVTSPQWAIPERRGEEDLSFVRVWASQDVRDEQSDGFKDLLQRYSQALDARLVFRVDGESGKLVAEIRDYATGELVRQIPPEELMRVSKVISEYLGLLVDERH